MNLISKIKQELKNKDDQEKAKVLMRFFKTKKGEYGEGDKFLGVTVPEQRKTAKNFFKEIKLTDLKELIKSPIHEYRLTALLILVLKFEKTKENKKQIIDFYLKNIRSVNNWDLVDLSAPKLLGAYLFANHNQDLNDILYKFARSKDLWLNRIAMLSTYEFIRNNDYKDTLKIAEILLNHSHDLIHKAVGWMLREVGNRDLKTELKFLDKYYLKMPRTMLRYAIEKFEKPLKVKYMQK
jgi:3-methyladenine DNA glycosylase AlkD